MYLDSKVAKLRFKTNTSNNVPNPLTDSIEMLCVVFEESVTEINISQVKSGN